MFEQVKARDYCTHVQKDNRMHIVKNLKKIDEWIDPKDTKLIRNWSRTDLNNLMQAAGFIPKCQLQGTHLEVVHPVFNFGNSESFRSKKAVGLSLKNNYLKNIATVLTLWHKKLRKSMKLRSANTLTKRIKTFI